MSILEKIAPNMSQDSLRATVSTSAILTGAFTLLILYAGWTGREFIQTTNQRLQASENNRTVDREQLIILKERMLFMSEQLTDLNLTQKNIASDLNYLRRDREEQRNYKQGGKRTTE